MANISEAIVHRILLELESGPQLSWHLMRVAGLTGREFSEVMDGLAAAGKVTFQALHGWRLPEKEGDDSRDAEA